jgi:hypothetical protein
VLIQFGNRARETPEHGTHCANNQKRHEQTLDDLRHVFVPDKPKRIKKAAHTEQGEHDGVNDETRPVFRFLREGVRALKGRPADSLQDQFPITPGQSCTRYERDYTFGAEVEVKSRVAMLQREKRCRGYAKSNRCGYHDYPEKVSRVLGDWSRLHIQI